MQQIGGCHRYRTGERCYILLLITICKMVTYPASNPYSICFPVCPVFILCQLGLLLKNAQCFSVAYRNRVTHLCLAPKAFSCPGPANCLNILRSHYCLTPVPVGAGPSPCSAPFVLSSAPLLFPPASFHVSNARFSAF